VPQSHGFAVWGTNVGTRIHAASLVRKTDRFGAHMSDDKSRRGSPDNKRIDVHDPNEVRHWTKSLDVTAEQLKEAVARVGTSAAKVREALKK
jgi:hypothetical protein